MSPPRTIDRTMLKDLYYRGWSVCDIARHMNVKPASIRVIASREKLNNGRKARPPVNFFMSDYDHTILKIEADKRGVNASELAHKIICTIIQDDMFDAVLDDGI